MAGIIIISIIFLIFFSGMEVAYSSGNRMLSELEKKKKSVFSKIYVFLIDHSHKYLISLKLGHILALVLYGYAMVEFLSENFTVDSWNYLSNILLQIFISAIIILIIGKLLSRIIFSIFPNQLFKFLSPIALFFYYLFYPITLIIVGVTNLMLKVSGEEKKVGDPETDLKDELSDFIDVRLEGVEKEKVDQEVHFFKNALNFSDLKARDCMIPRKEIVAVNIEDDINTVTHNFIESGFSKILVYRSNIDNIIGYIHIFDLFKRPVSIKHILLPIEMVHETTSSQLIMNRMLRKSRTIAVVLDEYGGTSGLLTLEDIVEELLGNIEDEYDKSEDLEKELEENHYLFSGRLSIEYLNEKYNFSLPENDEYSTLSGFIINITEEIPAKGKEIYYKNIKFIITLVSNSKIEEMEVIVDSE